MPDRIPPNLREAWETELRGLEARLARANDEQRATLERRIGEVRAQLGETPAAPVRGRRKANGAEMRPGGDGVEQA